jgi:hypothetical protein
MAETAGGSAAGFLGGTAAAFDGKEGARAGHGIAREAGAGAGQAAPAVGIAGRNASMVWSEVVESLRETRAGLASILDLCEPPALADGVLWLMLPSAFHQSQVLKAENLRTLTEKIVELTNTSVILRTKIADLKPDGKEAGRRRPLEDAPQFDAIAEKNPIVRALIENLGGKIVDVRRDRQGGPGGGRVS